MASETAKAGVEIGATHKDIIQPVTVIFCLSRVANRTKAAWTVSIEWDSDLLLWLIESDRKWFAGTIQPVVVTPAKAA